MSTSYYVACRKRNKRIRVASYGFGGFQFYLNEPACMKALHAFLEKHLIHSDPVVFLAEYECEGYEDIDWQRAPRNG